MLQLDKEKNYRKPSIKQRRHQLTTSEFYSSMLVTRLSLQRCYAVGILVEMLQPTAEPIAEIRVRNVAPAGRQSLKHRVTQSLQWKTFE